MTGAPFGAHLVARTCPGSERGGLTKGLKGCQSDRAALEALSRCGVIVEKLQEAQHAGPRAAGGRLDVAGSPASGAIIAPGTTPSGVTAPSTCRTRHTAAPSAPDAGGAVCGSPLDPETLAPGIRRTVALLRSWGYDTIDSGDGVTNREAGMECARDYPHVSILLGGNGSDLAARAVELMVALRRRGISTGEIGSGKPAIQASYDPETNVAMLEVIDLDDSKLPEVAE